MVGTTLMMLDQELCCKIFYCTTDKMTTLITSQDPRTSKPSDNVFKDKPGSDINRTILNNCFLIPSCQVISCSDNVSVL